MEKLIIKGEADKPFVHLDKDEGIFRMGGHSLPENVLEVYDPIINWIRNYTQQANESTNFEFEFDYLNTASSNMVVKIIRTIVEMKKNDRKIQITWYYNHGDFDMKDFGQEVLEDTGCSYKFIEKDPFD